MGTVDLLNSNMQSPNLGEANGPPLFNNDDAIEDRKDAASAVIKASNEADSTIEKELLADEGKVGATDNKIDDNDI